MIDPGQFFSSKPFDLDDIAINDCTITLNNPDGRYSPEHENFILGKNFKWHLCNFKVELEYLVVSLPNLPRLTLYKGLVLNWSVPLRKDPDSRAAAEAPNAEIHSVGFSHLLAQKVLGRSDSDGTRNPLVYGTVTKEAQALGDRLLWTPDATLDFEEGDTSDFDTVVTAGTGTVAASTIQKFAGSYSCKHNISGVTDQAYGIKNLSGPAITSVLASAQVYFSDVTGPFAAGVPIIMAFRTSASIYVTWVSVSATGLLQLVHYGGAYDVSSIDVTDLVGRWVGAVSGLELSTPGTIKLYLDGEVIAELPDNYAISVADGGIWVI